LLPADYPGEFNQALMDIGAQYCQARTTVCAACPLEPFCQTRKRGAPSVDSRALKKEEKPRRYATFFCVIADGKILLERRPEEGLLGGLYGLPTTPWTEKSQSFATATPAAITTKIAVRTAHLPIIQWRLSRSIEHTFTHFHLHAHVLVASIPWKEEYKHTGTWVPYSQLWKYGIPTAFKKAIRIEDF
jgi:A/G-specific adenine glycosylase